MAKALLNALDRSLAKAGYQPKGLSVAVLVPGRGRWTAQLGADGRGGPVVAATRFHAASSGKLLTAALVGAAANRGEIDLKATLGAVSADLPAPWRAIPLGTLLNHTSGLGTFDQNPRYDRFVAATPQELLGLTSSTLLFASGTAFRYSNTGYVLLGLALEHAAGRSWSEQVRTTLFAGLPGCTAVIAPECRAEDLAVGFFDGKPVPFHSDYRNVFSCGGIVCTALDLARLYEGILHARLIPDAAAALLFEAMVQQGDSAAVAVWGGRGINRVETPKGGFVLHAGGIGGFAIMAGVSLQTGVTVAVMANDSAVVPDDYFFGLSIAAADQLAAEPAITGQPLPLAAVAGQIGAIAVTATGAASYQWSKGGEVIARTNTATLVFPSIGPDDAGLYDVLVTGLGGEILSSLTVVGVVPARGERTAGAVSIRAEWQDIQHPNGAVYDQFLLTGAAGTFTADPGQIARLSYLDSNDSIVQVEMSGAGAITVSLSNASGPAAPALYNQSGIAYMKGKATVILSGADATTHFTIYSVGTATNPGVTRPEVPYSGWAEVAAAGIVGGTGGLGGIHQGNVLYNATIGYTGIYAPTVTSVGGLVVVHDIAASGSAQPYLYFGRGGSAVVKIAGGSLAQPNHDSISISGLAEVAMGAGRDSCGRDAPAQPLLGHLVLEPGEDGTGGMVVEP